MNEGTTSKFPSQSFFPEISKAVIGMLLNVHDRLRKAKCLQVSFSVNSKTYTNSNCQLATIMGKLTHLYRCKNKHCLLQPWSVYPGCSQTEKTVVETLLCF